MSKQHITRPFAQVNSGVRFPAGWGDKTDAAIADSLQGWLTRNAAEVSRMLARCESPIEIMFLSALLAHEFGASVDSNLMQEGHSQAVESGLDTSVYADARMPGGYLFLQPTMHLRGRKIRMDFASISVNCVSKVCIEVDGHDFHEATKEQAQRDKSRDRYLQAMGWKVVRFTGSEVSRNAWQCVEDLLEVW